MCYTLIGVTGWTLPQIAQLTLPQFRRLLDGQGQILYPRLRPLLDAQFDQISDEPIGDEKLSPIEKIIKSHHEAQAARTRGEKPPQTEKQKRRREAYDILYGYYLGNQQPVAQPKQGVVIPELPSATARAIVQFVQEGRMPSDIWARDVVPLWLDISATAKAKG